MKFKFTEYQINLYHNKLINEVTRSFNYSEGSPTYDYKSIEVIPNNKFSTEDFRVFFNGTQFGETEYKKPNQSDKVWFDGPNGIFEFDRNDIYVSKTNSPFIFSDQYEMSTGLFGVQNFQVQMNLASSPSRALRVASQLSVVSDNGDRIRPFTLGTTTWSTTGSYGSLWVSQPRLSVQFLTPALDVPLPPKSIVPYMDFPRYIGTPGTLVAASIDVTSAAVSLSSQTITLPNIPDLLVIYVKPPSYADATNGDWSLPITSMSLNFDNFSGLMSTMTQKQLYQMSVRNGVDMDWSEWSGLGNVPFNNSQDLTAFTLAVPAAGGQRGLIGGPLVLKPGVDFPLQTGQASGLVGNFTLQFSIGVQNFTGSPQTPNIYTVPISSGFFETIKGSSRIIKGVLTEQDILSSPAQAPSEAALRPVGAGRGGQKHMSVRGGMEGYRM